MDKVKQYIAALVVAGVFAGYSLLIRHHQPLITKPTGISNTASQATPATAASSTATPSQTTNQSYKDGSFTGSVADAFYGNIQVSVTISGGKIADIKFLQYPDTHEESVMINQQAMPYLKQEAIRAQSSNVQIVSGATYTSQAFQQSLQSALSQA